MELIRLDESRAIQVANTADIGSGGEAGIHSVIGCAHLVAKIYSEPRPLLFEKLRVMLSNPPRGQGEHDHLTTTWPVAILAQGIGARREVGYLMPRISMAHKVFEFFNPSRRREIAPSFNYKYLVRLARNVAVAFADVHRAGHVVGDVNESNILSAKTAMATLVDVDSFQIHGPNRTFRCPVGRGEYAPPELQGVRCDSVDRSSCTDVFGLSVLIFQILMEGFHPFDGMLIEDGEPNSREKRIQSGVWPYAGGNGYKPSATAPPLSMIDPDLRLMFWHCFVNGHKTPPNRPTAKHWATAIDAAEGRLVECKQNMNHFHWPHVAVCPWCDRYRLIGQDSFADPTSSSLSESPQPGAIYNTNIAFTLESARQLRNSGRFNEADLVLRRLLATGSPEAPCYFELGMVYTKRRKFAQASAHFMRAWQCGFRNALRWKEAVTLAATMDPSLSREIASYASAE